MSLTKVNLSLAQNQLTGALLTALIAQAAPRIEELYIDLSSNNFGGTIPNVYISTFNDNPGMMKKLSISLANCSLTGTIPYLRTKFAYLSLNVDNNGLAGGSGFADLMTQSSSTYTDFIVLSAAHNQFSGGLDIELDSSLHTEWDLNLYGNNYFSLSGRGNKIHSLNVGMNVNMAGQFFYNYALFQTFIANHTLLRSLPSLNSALGLSYLDLRGSLVQCAPQASLQWARDLQVCLLDPVLAQCAGLPEICKPSVYEAPPPPPAPLPIAPPVDVSPATNPPPSDNGTPSEVEAPSQSTPLSNAPFPAPNAAPSSLSGLLSLILAISLLLLAQ